MVNGEEWVFPNGQLKALVNGQLKALVNNFDVSGSNNNAKTLVLVDEDDLVKQSGDIGGMVSMAMITGNEVGTHKIIPAAFINENFEVTYEVGDLNILKAPIFIKAEDTSKVYGDENPVFSWSVSGTAYDENITLQDGEGPFSLANNASNVGVYPIDFNIGEKANYTIIKDFGKLTILPKTLIVKADNKTVVQGEAIPALTITYDGLVGDDTEDSVCVRFIRPASPKVINDYDRTITYTNVQINGASNVFFATPGQSLSLSGSLVSYNNPVMDCPGCITQVHIGIGDGVGNFFSTCYEVSGSGATWNLAQNFTAPTIPGVYYITQIGTWWYYCGQFPLGNHQVADINKFAIAVVIVNETGTETEEKISASVNADNTSAPGDYQISLQRCTNFNPNYNVVLESGMLTITPGCIITAHYWKGDGNFTDENGTGNGTPSGDVIATGEGKIGSNSFAFNGGFISTGTGGSVSGTGDFSVSAWVKTTSSNPMVIINQRENFNNDGEYMLKIGGKHYSGLFNEAFAGRAYFFIWDYNNNLAEVDLISNRLVNDGAWHFIKGERKGTTINLYIDGVLDTTANTAGVVVLNSSMRTFIGYDQLAEQALGQGSYFEGLIDDIKVSICDAGVGRMAGSASSSGPSMLSMTSVVVNEKVSVDKLYPNPASNTIRLQLTEDAISINEIQVFNGFGKTNNAQVRKINDGVYELNISSLSKGIYFIKTRTNSGIKTFKFIKM
jgi:hypothetical protein